MAASVFKTSDKCILNMVEGATGTLRNGGTYKLAFVTNSWTPSLTDTELWGDTGLSTNEIAGTGGYTTGGQALAGDVAGMHRAQRFHHQVTQIRDHWVNGNASPVRTPKTPAAAPAVVPMPAAPPAPRPPSSTRASSDGPSSPMSPSRTSSWS